MNNYSITFNKYANSAIAITPAASQIQDSNGNNIYPILYIGGAGNVVVITASGETITFTAVPVGTILPINVQQVLTTSTATNIVGLYIS